MSSKVSRDTLYEAVQDAREPAQAPQVSGNSGAADQPEELRPPEGQTFLGHRQA
ncbi:hypothetical protein LEMLEM_LOCUS12758 [Lemmus lemmus]